MKYLVCAISLIITNCSVSAQTLRGQITDDNNKPIAAATVYIKESATGIITDNNGEFQTAIRYGNYTVEIRSLGYETATKFVEILPEGAEIVVRLKEKPFQIREITVRPSKEDPAYQIMRNAVAAAPYHLRQLSAYTSEVYMKGNGEIERLSSLVKMAINDKKIYSLVGKPLVFESKNIVTFTKPSKYKQKVVAFKSSFPKELEPSKGISISTSSIYSSHFLGKVSPLSTQAFAYYKFKYQNTLYEDNHTIYRISFFPKLKSTQLSSGILYVVDSDWSIYAAEFETNDMGIKSHTKINYQELKPSVFLPITYEEKSEINLLGIKGKSHFLSSTKYSSVEINNSIVKPGSEPIAPEQKQKLSGKQTKALNKLKEIYQKDKFTTKDALNIAKLTSIVNNYPDSVKQKKTFELKPFKPVDLEKDSLAGHRDSLYWESVRTVPLTATEEKSYQYKDSFPKFDNITATDDEISVEQKKNLPMELLLGGHYKFNKKVKIYYSGLLDGLAKNYNFVDGFWIGQKVGIDIQTTNNTKFNFQPSAYYATARKSLIWDIGVSQQYAPMLNGQFWCSAGIGSQDIQQEKGVSRLFNSMAALLWGGNAISLYLKKYIAAANSLEIANSLNWSVGGTIEQRELSQNYTTYNLLKKPIAPNFAESRITEFPSHTVAKIWLGLNWTPYHYYKVKNGKKNYIYSKYPTFSLLYTKTVPVLGEGEEADFSKIELSVKDEFKVGLFNKVRYNLNIGSFLNKKGLFAPDYQYFSTSPYFFTHRTLSESFVLLPNYSNINSYWLESHLNWASEHLLFKRVSFLQAKAFSESLHFSTLWDYQSKLYNEIGYSVGFSQLLRVGLFGSFNGAKYNSFGVRINLTLFD